MTLIAAKTLHAPEVLHINDWHLPVTAVDIDVHGVAVVTSKLNFPLHFGLEQDVDVDEVLP